MTELERKLVALAAVAGAEKGGLGRTAADESHQVTIVMRRFDLSPFVNFEVIVGDKSGDGTSLEEAVDEAVKTILKTTAEKVSRIVHASMALNSLHKDGDR